MQTTSAEKDHFLAADGGIKITSEKNSEENSLRGFSCHSHRGDLANVPEPFVTNQRREGGY